uniref:Malonyl CoA:ACP acyltransferase (mitochondrial) n=1 Tax=Eptatretus burgeri TaxID=7764 RepID=A0A8C4PYX4_EPTBU
MFSRVHLRFPFFDADLSSPLSPGPGAPVHFLQGVLGSMFTLCHLHDSISRDVVEKTNQSNLTARSRRVVDECRAVAGYSLGELTALVIAGTMTFEDGLRVVAERGVAMGQASLERPGGMLTVGIRMGTSSTAIDAACQAARDHCIAEMGTTRPVCQLASYLYPGVRVIAGDDKALKYIQSNAASFGLTRPIRLPVSGAFHTDMMASAVGALDRTLETISLVHPRIPVIANVTAKRYGHGPSIRKNLLKQLIQPVLWEQTMTALYQRPQQTNFPISLEVGPGGQLGMALRKTNRKAWFEQDCSLLPTGSPSPFPPNLPATGTAFGSF